MKTIIRSLAFALFLPAGLLAQGRVNFNNSSATPIRLTDSAYYFGVFQPGVTNVLGTASTAHFGIGPASVRVQLFAGLTSTSLSPVLIGSDANLSAVTNTANTTLAILQGTFSGGSNLALAGFDGSAPVFLQFTAFSLNGFYGGSSPIIQVALATGGSSATSLFSATPTANQWDGILIGYPELYPAPEPATGALFALSVSLIILARRRR